MRGVISIVREDAGKSVTSRKDSSGFDLIIQAGFVHFSQEAAVPVQMCSNDYDGPCRRLLQNDEINSLSVSSEKDPEPFGDYR